MDLSWTRRRSTLARAAPILLGTTLVTGCGAAPATPNPTNPAGTVDDWTAPGLNLSANGDAALGVWIRQDGRIVVARSAGASIQLHRYNVDGTIDLDFGQSGSLTLDQAWASGGSAVDLGDDGRVVVLSTDFVATRYEPGGAIDADFGDQGHASAIFTDRGDTAHAVAIGRDGGIVVAGATGGEVAPNEGGMTGITPDAIRFAVARFHADGSPDASWGTNGQAIASFSAGADEAYALAIEPDGSMVVVGSTGFMTSGGQDNDFAIARLDPHGSPDLAFGQGGRVETHLPGTAANRALAVVIQPDGRIVVAGYAQVVVGTDPVNWPLGLALARYNPDGTLDRSFGNLGTLADPEISGELLQVVIALQPDNWIVVATSDGQLVRYDPTGTRDLTFREDAR